MCNQENKIAVKSSSSPSPSPSPFTSSSGILSEILGNLVTGDEVFDKVRTAIAVKFGEGRSVDQAVQFFMDFADKTIAGKVGDSNTEPTLLEKLEALKREVGEDIFKGLLANPTIQSLADDAWQRDYDTRMSSALKIIAVEFNGAVSEEDVAYFIGV